MPVLSLALLLAAPAVAAQAPAAESPTVAATTLPDGWDAALQHRDRGARGEPDGFQRCGEAFLAIHLGAPDGPRVSTALYNAAQCFEAAYMWPAAAQAYERLLAVHPGSEHAQKTRENLVFGYLAVTRFDDAARHAERYAQLYPKDSYRTPDMLLTAYRLRVGLGQRDLALAALDGLEQLYRRKHPELAAKYFWMRRELLTRDDERREHAMTYLEHHGKTGPYDLRLVAEAIIGQLLWRRSCEKGYMFDTCATLQRARTRIADESGRHPRRPGAGRRPLPPPPTCQEPGMIKRQMYPRTRKGAEEAQRWFLAVHKGARRRYIMVPEDDLERRRAFRDAVTMAAVYLADRGFEELLVLLEELREAPEQELAPLLPHIARLSEELRQRYVEEIIADDASIVWSIAAAARNGQIAEYRADSLLSREIPRAHHDRTPGSAHCDMLREQAAPLYAAAVAAYEHCLELSISTSTFTDFSRLCEQALHDRDPARFPLTPEFINTPVLLETRPITVGVQLEAPPELATANE